jgi:hypothetical protein
LVSCTTCASFEPLGAGWVVVGFGVLVWLGFVDVGVGLGLGVRVLRRLGAVLERVGVTLGVVVVLLVAFVAIVLGVGEEAGGADELSVTVVNGSVAAASLPSRVTYQLPATSNASTATAAKIGQATPPRFARLRTDRPWPGSFDAFVITHGTVADPAADHDPL